MSRQFRLLICTALVVGGSTAVWSQVYRGPYGGVHRVYPGYGGWWGGFNYSGNIGVTPAESQARGSAEAVRAQGQAYEHVTTGMVDYEKARSAYIANQKQWHETALQRQEMGLAQREKYYANERAKRERRESMNSNSTAPRLSESQYDRSTGQLEWPDLLQEMKYDSDRKAIGDLLMVRAQAGSSAPLNDQLFTSARALQNKLKAQIRDVSPQRYLEARKFLDLLASEARLS